MGERARVEGVREVEATFLLAAVNDDDVRLLEVEVDLAYIADGEPRPDLGLLQVTECGPLGRVPEGDARLIVVRLASCL